MPLVQVLTDCTVDDVHINENNCEKCDTDTDSFGAFEDSEGSKHNKRIESVYSILQEVDLKTCPGCPAWLAVAAAGILDIKRVSKASHL